MSARAWKARRANRTEVEADFDAREDRLSNRDDKAEARTMLACPYYRGTGTCGSGCYDEPRCQADEPSAGWSSVARRLT